MGSTSAQATTEKRRRTRRMLLLGMSCYKSPSRRAEGMEPGRPAGCMTCGMLTALIALVLGGAPQPPAISFWSNAAGRAAQVWVMNVDGSSRQRLTSLYSAKRGDWSPDGRRLVFDGRFYRTLFDFDIGVMNADGTGVRRITRGPERDIMASWSPDARWIAFSRLKSDGGIPDLWLVRPDGRGAHLLVRQAESPAWSPDGRLVAFDGPGGIWTVRPDGSGLRKLVAGEAGEPSWSPDGGRIAYTRWGPGRSEIYVANADGRRPRRLTRNTLDDFGARWSPDGSRILYTHGTNQGHQVYVMQAGGSAKTNLSRNRFDEWATDWR
jgi:Tol biopolymer transport system component